MTHRGLGKRPPIGNALYMLEDHLQTVSSSFAVTIIIFLIFNFLKTP